MFEMVAMSLPVKICTTFRKALTNGCWGNGRVLSAEHRRICEEVLLYHEEIGQSGCH